MSENTRELTLEEAKKLYKFIRNKFTILELNCKITQEDFNLFFQENILTMVDQRKSKFIDSDGYKSKIPTSRIQLNNADGDWLFEYDYNQKNTHFWYSYYRIGVVLCKHFAISESELELLMKYNIEKTFKILNTIPSKHREIQ